MANSIATRYEYDRAPDGSWFVWDSESKRTVIYLVARKWQVIWIVEELTKAASIGYAEGYRDGSSKAEGRS